MSATLSPQELGATPRRETRSARIEARTRPSLKARAEAVAASAGQSLSDYAMDALEAAVRRDEARARREAERD